MPDKYVPGWRTVVLVSARQQDGRTTFWDEDNLMYAVRDYPLSQWLRKSIGYEIAVFVVVGPYYGARKKGTMWMEITNASAREPEEGDWRADR